MPQFNKLKFKTILMTAAILAVPSMAFAQVDAVKDKAVDMAKDQAVDAVMDNMTADDAMVAGKTLITGGSKEDAAKAVVKNRVDDKVDAMTEGMADKAAGSATKYGDKAGMVDKEPSSAATYGSAVIQKGGAATPAPATTAVMPVNCPSGTTAQPDGTCMITGNWGG